MYGSGRAAADIVAAEGLGRIDDAGGDGDGGAQCVEGAMRMRSSEYRAGKRQTFGFLVGQVIKSMGGKADPALVNAIMKRELDGDAA